VIAVMLPSTSFILSSDKAPVEKFRNNGIPMALGSDFNPGSSPICSMPLVISFACYHYKMSIEEAIAAATINAAYALNRGNLVGSLEVGKKADLLILEYKDIRELPYWIASNPIDVCLKNGRIYFDRENY
jgi:imidazolonepropionase